MKFFRNIRQLGTGEGFLVSGALTAALLAGGTVSLVSGVRSGKVALIVLASLLIALSLVPGAWFVANFRKWREWKVYVKPKTIQ